MGVPYTSVQQLPDRVRAEFEQFFLAAVAFEGKQVRLLGWEGPDQALETIRTTLRPSA